MDWGGAYEPYPIFPGELLTTEKCEKEAVIALSCISTEEPTRLLVSSKLKVTQMFLVNSMDLKKNSKVTNVRLVKTFVGPRVRMGNKGGGREIKVGSYDNQYALHMYMK